MANEADTCRKYVLPKLYAAGWTDDQITEQRYFTDGRIVTLGRSHYRKPGKKMDYLRSAGFNEDQPALHRGAATPAPE